MIEDLQKKSYLARIRVARNGGREPKPVSIDETDSVRRYPLKHCVTKKNDHVEGLSDDSAPEFDRRCCLS